MNERALLMFDAITEIRDDIIEKATDYKFKKSPMRFLRSISIAAGICFVLGAAILSANLLSGTKDIRTSNYPQANTETMISTASTQVSEEELLPSVTEISQITTDMNVTTSKEIVPQTSGTDTVSEIITETTSETTATETKTAITSQTSDSDTASSVTTAATTETTSTDTTADTTAESEGDVIVDSGADSCYILMSFDDVVKASYSIAVVRCDAVLPDVEGMNDETGAYAVTTDEILLGNDLPENFIIRNISSSDLILEEGECYVVFLGRSSSVFYDEDRYYIDCRTFMLLNDDGFIEKTMSQGSETDIGIYSLSELRQYFSDNNLHAKANEGIKYTTSSDIKDVVNESEYVLEVKIKEIQIDFVPDRTTYTVEIINKYKYMNEITPDGIGNLTITVPKSLCAVGNNYVVLVNSLGSGSGSFVVSSRKLSVFPADSPEAQEIIEIVKNQEQ